MESLSSRIQATIIFISKSVINQTSMLRYPFKTSKYVRGHFINPEYSSFYRRCGYKARGKKKQRLEMGEVMVLKKKALFFTYKVLGYSRILLASMTLMLFFDFIICILKET